MVVDSEEEGAFGAQGPDLPYPHVRFPESEALGAWGVKKELTSSRGLIRGEPEQPIGRH